MIAKIYMGILSGVLLSISTSVPAFATEGLLKDWNGITPCTSTRFDVEKRIGKDSSSISSIGSYKHNELHISIHYITRDALRRDVDLVEKISVRRDEPLKLKNYIRGIPNFQKDFIRTELPDEITHVNKMAVYRNWPEGFEIWVQRTAKNVEMITGFGYFAPNLHLRSGSNNTWCS